MKKSKAMVGIRFIMLMVPPAPILVSTFKTLCAKSKSRRSALDEFMVAISDMVIFAVSLSGLNQEDRLIISYSSSPVMRFLGFVMFCISLLCSMKPPNFFLNDLLPFPP
eukprot:CAMPEP_0118637812 /NCGR_PEP_ID=MMETSP0785-20121206/3350_1 /TAXON_ID=91992 /ORGANISM="Bolidomonas pacifica, Strain CCMP 1866" /LENGTH=108 /DNA_ID=CAMNT_0006529019 /DNA_START=232 /DNA_END=561 /DNA_ORIENTATION=-